MDDLEIRSSEPSEPSASGGGGGNRKPNRDQVRDLQVQRKPKKRGRPRTKPIPRNANYTTGYINNEWQDGGIRGRILIIGKPGSGKSYLLKKRVRDCRRVILFNTANVDSFDDLNGFTRISKPEHLKQLMRASWPEGNLRIIYTPLAGDKIEHFELVCRIIKAFGENKDYGASVTLAVDEIDSFMTANNLGTPAFYDLTNYGRHLKVALAGTTRNTVAVSRQFTSMLTEICIFAITEPRYLKYLEDTCGAHVSDMVPLLGTHQYIRWQADGTATTEKGWGNR